MHGLTHDEDHGYMLADQDVGIQYSETVLDSVIDRYIQGSNSKDCS